MPISVVGSLEVEDFEVEGGERESIIEVKEA